MKSLDWHAVCQRRLSRQHLRKPATRMQVAEVVGDLCGIQAQVITAAELAIGARVEGITQEDVRRELWEERTLVKTYGPRSTLHLLPANELSRWMAAMRARSALYESRPYEASGLEPGQAETLLKGIGEALDNRCLTRDELAHEVSDRVGSWARESLQSTWGIMLAPAAYEGLLCFGPSQGSKVTFVRAEQWVKGWKEVNPISALKGVTRRYLATYGPATYRDFGRWFALKPEDALSTITSLGEEVEEVDFEGLKAWVLSADLERWSRSGDREESNVRLLPQYETYVLGNGPRDRIVPEIAHKRIFSYGRGRYEGAVALPILLVDGVVSGIWERKMGSKSAKLRVEPFVELTSHQRTLLEAEAHRVGAFFGIEVELTLGRLD